VWTLNGSTTFWWYELVTKFTQLPCHTTLKVQYFVPSTIWKVNHVLTLAIPQLAGWL